MKRGNLLLSLIFIIVFSLFSFAASDDSDGDGIKDINDKFIYDFDNDGLPDDYEIDYDLDMQKNNAGVDTDGDGLLDLKEYELGTEPNNIDTDGDGYLDGEEVLKGTNPTNKYSPFEINKLISLLLPILIGTLIIILVFYLVTVLLKKKDEPNEEEETETKKSSIPKESKLSSELSQNKPKQIKEKKKDVKEKEEDGGVLTQLKKLFELILGPDIKKHNKKKREEENSKDEDSSNDEDFDEDFENVINDDGKPIDPNAFLMRTLNKNKRKNKIQNVFDYFDKEIKEEELSFLKEKKTKKEIIDFLNSRKEMKKKILEELKREKEEIDKPKSKNENKSEEITQDTVFEKLEKISDEAYDKKLR